MTRRDFILLSDTLRRTQERIKKTVAHHVERDQQLRGVRRAAANIAGAIAADNPTFDAQRFLTDCGYGGDQ